MDRFVIGEVLDLNTGKRSDEFAYRVGRKCAINLDYLQEGICLLVEYPERKAYFRTSIVKEIEQTDYGFWVKTMNSHYRFDRCNE